ncbi:tail collar domain-containing protein [Pseudogulbenkiania sp. NH8B]|uniref:tail collar domain-containing protein n=1 Tax=Pseudogulbenkiania sp. (strain NH8B) TaxID=748280 RepID=UPI0002279AFC|nr:tail collar domain-containing protein [Pseudogulbenkiania sp. NH8B]BAK75825.1 tail collar domain-containing protein [Pseudogulbenkiania sp. NH8B]
MAISNANGAAVRADVSAALQALASNNGGNAAPGVTYPGMWWSDTASGVLKQRNAGNTGWVVRASLAETMVVPRVADTALVVGDYGRCIIATGSWTQSLDGAATLGDGWYAEYRNNGTGVITLDPISGETIDGASTVQLAPGEACKIFCSGMEFHTVGRTASAQQNQTATAFDSTGVAPSYALTPVPALTAYAGNTRFHVKFHAAGTGADTLNVSTLGAKSIKQYDSVGNKVAPVIVAGQLADLAYDGVDFVILDPLPPALGMSVPVRQTVLSGVADANGRANFISAGAGLACSLSATAAALVLAFSAGFGPSGQVDYVERLTADAANFWSALPANNLNYLTVTRNGSGNLSAGSTLAPVQYGYAYNKAAQALLHFDGVAGSTSFLDDFGNTWTAQGGAKLQSNWSKFGGTALGGGGANNALNGTTDYIKTSSITTLGNGGWALRAHVRPTAIPGAGGYALICNLGQASSQYGVYLCIFNNGGVTKFTYFLSSNGTSWDISGGTQGTTTPVANTDYFVELTYDPVAGVYRLNVNGNQEASTASALKVCAGAGLAVGGVYSYATNLWTGYIDEFEFLPYCDHPAGTAYTVPTAAKSIATPGYASDWFDLSTFTMKSPSAASTGAGSNPTFTTSNKLYVGEAVTGAAGVSSVVSYAYQGRYHSADTAIPGVSTRTVFSSNLGVPTDLRRTRVRLRNYTADAGFTPGMVTTPGVAGSSTYAGGEQTALEDRNTVSVVTGSQGNGFILFNRTSGAAVACTAANWKMFVDDERAF